VIILRPKEPTPFKDIPSMNPVMYLEGSIPARPAIALNETDIVSEKMTIIMTDIIQAASSLINYTTIGKRIVKIDATKKQTNILCLRGIILKNLIAIA
jgi:hypothetical protein